MIDAFIIVPTKGSRMIYINELRRSACCRQVVQLLPFVADSLALIFFPLNGGIRCHAAK